MSKYDDYLKDANEHCQGELTTAIEKLAQTAEPDVEQFQKNTLDNIPQQFGDFLYTALGDRITGQRSSVLNQTYIDNNGNGQGVAERAKENNRTIEEQAAHEQAEWDKKQNTTPSWQLRYDGNHVQPQLWLTAGRKFGVSYLTGKGDRFHTIYFGEGECFAHLRQGHVDCVKNKLKRKCTQDFLDFRDDYVLGVENLTDQLVQVNVPVKLGVVSCVTKSVKINSHAGSYRDTETKTFHVLDEVIDDTVTHIIATVNKVDVWDGASEVVSRDVTRTKVNEPSFISLTFLKIDDARKTISIVGNFDMNVSNVKASVQKSLNYNTRDVLNHLSEIETSTYRFINNPAFKGTGYQAYDVVDASGVLMNMHDVLTNPAVKSELDKRVKFYNDMSERLQRLKHDNATLYFVNADI